jgi:hypothetical protein
MGIRKASKERTVAKEGRWERAFGEIINCCVRILEVKYMP